MEEVNELHGSIALTSVKGDAMAGSGILFLHPMDAIGQSYIAL